MKQNRLKKKPNTFQFCLLLAFAMVSSIAVSQNFAWMKGSSTNIQPGVYGTIGTPAIANTPGAREVPVSWTDAAGNFWLFGGFGYDGSSSNGLLNDLWKYSPSTNQWTWVSGNNIPDDAGVYGTLGTPSSLNVPGARMGSAAWADASGNLWLFGGQGWDATGNFGLLNDLWKYNITSNQWTWMKGSNLADANTTYGSIGVPAAPNTPGGRNLSGTWTDPSGNLYLIGGSGLDGTGNYGDLNDLWRYNITSGQWTWLKGSNTTDQNGVYGTIGVAASGNMPGGRNMPNCWRDATGTLWLFGGAGYDASTSFEDYLNDLWSYNPATNQWTWVKGSNLSGAAGVYGTIGTPAPGNVPGARVGGTSWIDASGNFFLFGGGGYDGSSNVDLLNDLWKYNPGTNQWSWIKGSNTISQNGVYGTLGVAAPANGPGGRGSAAGWIDGSNNLWLFGGFGYDDSSTFPDDLNDLWRLTNCATTPTINAVASASALCIGGTASLTATGAVAYLWNNTQAGATIVVTPTVTGQLSYTVVGTDVNGCTGSASASISVAPLPVVTAVSNKSVSCAGEQVTLSANGALTYSWSTAPVVVGASLVISPTVTTVYVVTGKDGNGCVNTYSISQSVNICTGINEATGLSTLRKVYPNPGNGSFTISGEVFDSGSVIVVFNTLGQKVYETTLSGEDNHVRTDLNKGVYYFNILTKDQKGSSGKFIIE